MKEMFERMTDNPNNLFNTALVDMIISFSRSKRCDIKMEGGTVLYLLWHRFFTGDPRTLNASVERVEGGR
jgi:hypothetical protein